MAIYLDEDEVGSDPRTIGYPHLVLCMGVTVVMSDGSLIGAHVSNPSTENNVLGQLLVDIQRHGGAMTQLYCAADVAEHCGVHHCLDITGKANALGFSGPGYLFDFGYIKAKDGAYFEVTSAGANAQCALRFKRNENVAYTPGAGANATKATKDWFGKDKTFTKSTNTVAIGGKAKKFLGVEYGNHHIKDVPAAQLKSFQL